ncbi:GL18041 [Drosophila persimilis]|uniref:GL18041 n=1 Tax=Drosophila persimilis TaxID=7234 RepID=B4H2B0_DROPE|nr:GL18041 [Drosophila persimilis]
MYRAVMEEVARFFERYQQQLHLQQTHRHGEQIARSKSLHHVHGVGVGVGRGRGLLAAGRPALAMPCSCTMRDMGASASYLAGAEQPQSDAPQVYGTR